MGKSSLGPLAENQSAVYRVEEVALSDIEAPSQRVRLALDQARVEELASSIRDHGLLQLPGLRKVGKGWEVVWGWHRIEAVRRLGWRRVRARIVEADDSRAVVLQVAENLERHDMSPVEESAAVGALYKALGEDVDAVARRLNRSRAWIEGRLLMLGWPADILELLHGGRLSVGAAAELAQISDEGQRRFLTRHAVDGGATARTVMAWRIAWQSTGLVDTAAVAQVRPGAVPAIPEEARLPCYCCDSRRPMGSLVHVWVCPECRAALQSVVAGASVEGGNGGGA